MPYIESYILPVEASRFDDYARIAAESAAIWLELGALSVMEAKGDATPVGNLTSFPRAVHMAEGEVVVVASVTFRDRAHRDAVMARVETDQRMEALFRDAPVDGRRMIWGGFDVFVAQGPARA